MDARKKGDSIKQTLNTNILEFLDYYNAQRAIELDRNDEIEKNQSKLQ